MGRILYLAQIIDRYSSVAGRISRCVRTMPAHLSDSAMDEDARHPSSRAGLCKHERLFLTAKSPLSSSSDIPACQLPFGVSALLACGAKRIADGVHRRTKPQPQKLCSTNYAPRQAKRFTK